MSLYVCVCVSVSIFSSKTNSCFFMHGLWAGRCVCVCVCVGVCVCVWVCVHACNHYKKFILSFRGKKDISISCGCVLNGIRVIDPLFEA